ncbi:penicillin-binding protein 2 [Corynebacterium sp. 153RC1]|uniref:peptidoglycan D,D-transpeptidase FtsI family protein n=1 Tax=unclassified Corynebacterium TaxID=2624378 RepID=UPI00211BC88B|nr:MULTISPECIES: penicillin-binding protein 2 [unclassified Corynebacterium]MCQ9369806.1 penicillin-binding protein 2 [Corynebacterium sp. 35RC1]MCQ9352252.1 penicillin-binding protein 2 [Corynebacterium sp. 209RC1]MCQ9355444.1 penicillin-binding protein 2 [Corynebacterium sp. 1222RC1]MCQ9356640.1 penicillin-binding protein 2 [Corynebacterium sp. 122RC1]MCQ9359819.1 penicillin-binding protein 2 [Corynebacterium sp. 142RC1]
MSRRVRIATGLVLLLTIGLVVRLAMVQTMWGPGLAEQAQEQRKRTYVDSARRGEILDNQGKQIAYTMQARSLTVSPNILREELRYNAMLEMQESGDWSKYAGEAREQQITERVQGYLEDYSEQIPEIITASAASNNNVKPDEILEKLNSDSTYQVLVRNVDPDVAEDIASKFHGVAADMQNIRQYPNGAIAENIVGKISADGQGQFGFEASNDALLSGIDGNVTVDVSTDGQAIPGTTRDVVPAVDGAQVTLTLDLDLQTYVQQAIEQARANSNAESASAVVLDAKTGKVLAMANTDTIDPNGDIQKQLEEGKVFDNTSISAPFEPGSVAKIITAAGAIEDGLTTPDEVLQVPGSIDMAGVTVRDAWDHGVVGYTTTGIFGKSSNVGTLMLAQRLGEARFDQLLTDFGIGQSTGIELPAESQGLLPQFEQWSGGTFANLPIGQGMSWTLLQMASVYQTLANGGERVEPRIIEKVVDSQGNQVEQPAPEVTQVVSESTARTVVDMFRSVAQSDPMGVQQGTGAGAAIEGYQVSGKTGTAQQVDPNTGAYSNSAYWITFAGIAPADDPRFVVALMLDKPQRGVHGEGGQSSAPLFHDIASWLLDRENVPLSRPMEGQLILQAQ